MQLKDHKLLARLMAIQGVSGRQLADDAGWSSHTYLQRLLRGEVNTLKPGPAAAIAASLNVPLDVLFVTRMDRKTGRNGQENRTKKMSA
jgi:transcriptional regulator with XRE-family HTH domain